MVFGNIICQNALNVSYHPAHIISPSTCMHTARSYESSLESSLAESSRVNQPSTPSVKIT